jgi:diguanylate cyclase (GGDEF)-like protein
MDLYFNREKSLKAAEKFAQQGLLDDAIRVYRRVLEATPDDHNTANTIGDLFVRKRNPGEAIQYFVRVAENFEAEGFRSKAIAMYKKMAKLVPANRDIMVRLADLYTKSGLIGDANQLYTALLDSYKKAGDPREGLRAIKKICDGDSTNTKLRLALAGMYEQEGMAVDASEAYRMVGQELLRRDAGAEGIKALEKALELKPDSRPALKTLAEAHAARGDVQAALDMIARSLEIDPNDIDLIIILGRTFLNAGMLEKAEATFNRLFKRDNSRYDYLFEVARAYVDKGEYNRTLAIVDLCVDVVLARRHKKKATALLKSILERDPDNVLALKRLAGIYKSVRERRNLVNTLNRLVQAALAQDMSAEAVAALRQLVDIEPEKATYQKQLASLDPEEKAETSDDDVESMAALAEWTRSLTGQTAALATATQAAVVVTEEVDDSYGDYSTELLEEMVAQHPEFLAARLKLLEDLVAHQPVYVEGRIKLKQLYIDSGQKASAAAQCLEIANHFESRGDREQARSYFVEAYALNPELADVASEAIDVEEEKGLEILIELDMTPLPTPAAPAPAKAVPAPAKAAPAPSAPVPAASAPVTPAPPPLPVAGPPSIQLNVLLGLTEFERYFEWEWRRATREDRPLSFLKIAVDHFDNYTDTFGTERAIHILEKMAGAIEVELKKSGQLMAYCGGDEFFVLLPEATPSLAATTAEAVRKAVAALRIERPNKRFLSISIGIATAFPSRIASAEPLVVSVDQALSRARASGNSVISSPLLGGS